MEECCFDPAGQAQIEAWVSRIRKKEDFLGLVGDRRYHLKLYKKSFFASDFVDFLLKNGEAAYVDQGVLLGQKLVDYDLIHHVCDQSTFKYQKMLFRFREDEPDFGTGPSVSGLRKACGISKSGDLIQKGVFTWRKRYGICKADEQTLYLFGSELDSSPKVVISLAEVQCLSCETGACKAGFYCFVLKGKFGKLVFCSQKSKDQEAWIQALSEAGAKFQEEKIEHTVEQSLFEFSAIDLEGNNVDLATFRGKVCLVVNVASK